MQREDLNLWVQPQRSWLPPVVLQSLALRLSRCSSLSASGSGLEAFFFPGACFLRGGRKVISVPRVHWAVPGVASAQGFGACWPDDFWIPQLAGLGAGCLGVGSLDVTPAMHLTFRDEEEILVARRTLGPSSAQSPKLGYSMWGRELSCGRC